ncbi:MAG: 50S ribosomal protein L21e [Candidatus Bathyarchaeota archaeon]
MKSKGIRRNSRSILKKKARERGMQPLGRLLHKYNGGEKVLIKIDSSVHKGMPHSRFYGKIGVVVEQRGQAYVIELREYRRTRDLIIRPEHLRPYSDSGGAKIA